MRTRNFMTLLLLLVVSVLQAGFFGFPKGPNVLFGGGGGGGGGGGDGDCPLSFTLFVDGETFVSPGQQDGSVCAPYSTIQAAVDAIPEAMTPDEARTVYTILIYSGIYDEDVTVTGKGRRVVLMGIGPVTLGVLPGPGWTGPSPNPRNVTWTTEQSTGADGIREALVITTLIPLGEGGTTHESYLTKFRISGDLIATNAVPQAQPVELQINCEIFGDLDLSAHADQVNLYMYHSRVRGTVPAGNILLQAAQFTRFDGLISIQQYRQIIGCRFDSGLTVAAVPAPGADDMFPVGMLNTQFSGTYTGPNFSLLLDGVTNFKIMESGATVPVAAKVLIDLPA